MSRSTRRASEPGRIFRSRSRLAVWWTLWAGARARRVRAPNRVRSAQPADRKGTVLAAQNRAMDRELRISVLRRAAAIAGGNAQLRALLGVEQHALDLWLAGRATVPESVFLLAVDVILRDDV